MDDSHSSRMAFFYSSLCVMHSGSLVGDVKLDEVQFLTKFFVQPLIFFCSTRSFVFLLLA